MTKVTAIKCLNCGAVVFSRTTHDFRPCPCGSIAIDGGFDYTKVCYPPHIPAPKVFKLEVEQTPQELYDDWNYCRDKFGIIPGKVANES